jgi:hypothetical protein
MEQGKPRPLPFRATLEQAFVIAIERAQSYALPLVLASAAWTLVATADMPAAVQTAMGREPLLTRLGSPDVLWQARIILLVSLALASTALLACSVHRSFLGARRARPWYAPAGPERRYSFAFLALLLASGCAWSFAAPLGSAIHSATFDASADLYPAPHFGPAARWLEIACFISAGLLLHLPLARLLPALPAIAISDDRMSPVQSYRKTRGSGLRLLLGTAIAAAAIPALGVSAWHAMGAALPALPDGLRSFLWVLMTLIGVVVGLGFVAKAYEHFASGGAERAWSPPEPGPGWR